MFLLLWNYLHGYVIINVSGFSVERFMNLAALKNIYIWDVYPQGNGISMKVSIHGFKLLKDCCRKTGCRCKIIQRKGFPFFLHHYQKRKALGFGILFFIIGLYVLSSFIWVIEVEGNERISETDILGKCEQFGLKPGSLKFQLDVKNISEGLIETIPEISWVGVKITGTNVRISIVETILTPEVVDRKTPCDIVADKDGVIVSIATSSGTPLVKQGDVVSAGDILVASEVLIKEADEIKGKEYVHAQAQVIAKLWYTMEEQKPLKFTEKVYTGNVFTDSSIIISSSEINVVKPNIEFENYDTVLVKDMPLKIGDYVLPISLKEYEYREYKNEQRKITQQEAQNDLEQTIRKKTLELLPEDSEILDTNLVFETKQDTLICHATVTVTQRIDKKRFLDNNEWRNEDSGETDEH